jgi:hypothetical protein
MEKFLASRGRMSGQSAFSSASASGNHVQPNGGVHFTPGSSAGDSVGAIHPIAPNTVAVNNNNNNKAALVRSIVPPLDPAAIHLIANKQPQEKKSTRAEVDLSEIPAKVAPPRRHYATTEEKIQAEFREMKKREEELKVTRMKMFAKSQPNLLACLNQEDDDNAAAAAAALGLDLIEESGSHPLRAAVSNPNLLDDVDGDLQQQALPPQVPVMERESSVVSSSSSVKGARRKSALIAQWENRIQQNDH